MIPGNGSSNSQLIWLWKNEIMWTFQYTHAHTYTDRSQIEQKNGLFCTGFDLKSLYSVQLVEWIDSISFQNTEIPIWKECKYGIIGDTAHFHLVSNGFCGFCWRRYFAMNFGNNYSILYFICRYRALVKIDPIDRIQRAVNEHCVPLATLDNPLIWRLNVLLQLVKR